jgi:hypothetical protein
MINYRALCLLFVKTVANPHTYALPRMGATPTPQGLRSALDGGVLASTVKRAVYITGLSAVDRSRHVQASLVLEPSRDGNDETVRPFGAYCAHGTAEHSVP